MCNNLLVSFSPSLKMSVGPFICGMRRFDKHRVANDKPNNKELHNEQQQKLSELLRLREEQDKGAFPSVTPSIALVKDDTPIILNDTYTPWKTPSSTVTYP